MENPIRTSVHTERRPHVYKANDSTLNGFRLCLLCREREGKSIWCPGPVIKRSAQAHRQESVSLIGGSMANELSYNCPFHGLDAGCKCPQSGYREARQERDRNTELRRLRREVKELKKAGEHGK